MNNIQKAGFIVAVSFIVVLVTYAFSPLLYDKQVSEDIAEINTPTKETETGIEIVGEGSFIGLEGHNAKGTTKLLKADEKYFVRLEDDFEVTNGPDLFVFLGKDGKYDPSAEVGRLKGNVGGQNYNIPDNIDIGKYNEVWIWCKAFSVDFAKAPLGQPKVL